ncbi:uncharacterized protein LOC6052492 [Culex quinquefasciatus]|uniref:uncharacterized protein LOC6052492 n=1 Tax=Culex quinquefasciatus TaxID=7176 RepID=UPI0018E2D526|nr:uncharacterized protein LOC6052492 [Culex quinquefasciatus]
MLMLMLMLMLNVMPVVPELGTIQNFLQQQIKLDLSSVRNLQVNVSRNQVIIETTTPDQAFAIARDHNSKHFIVHAKKRLLIPIYVEDGAIEVKVHDLPPRMPNNIIEEHLKQYGEITSIHNEVWHDFFPGIPNGVRVARMKIKQPIPSFVQIEGMSAYIVHKDQIKTCRYCSQKIHAGQKCNVTKHNNNTISDEEDEDNTVKTSEPAKLQFTNDIIPDLSFLERIENTATRHISIDNLTNDQENLLQMTKKSSTVQHSAGKFQETKKKIRRLNLAQKCVNKKPNKYF